MISSKLYEPTVLCHVLIQPTVAAENGTGSWGALGDNMQRPENGPQVGAAGWGMG